MNFIFVKTSVQSTTVVPGFLPAPPPRPARAIVR